MPPPDQRKTYAPASSLEVFHTGGPIALSRDGKLVAAACQEAINVVEVSTGKTLHNLPGDTEPITALAWSRDGKKIFSASRSMRCSVWDATTGESVRTFKAHNTPILHMTVDPSGTLLATCSADRTARVWDVAKGFCTHAFRGHAAMVTTALFHPDAKRLVLYTGAHDGEVRAWDLRTRECVGSMREHTSSVTSLAVPTASKNGSEKLLSAARDRVVHEWCSKTYKRLSTTPTHEACEGMAALDPRRARGMIGAAAADAKPDAAYFVTAGDKGIVRIWRVGSAKPIARGNSLKEESGLMTGGAHDGDAEGDEAAAGSFTSLQLNANGDGVLAVTGDHRLLFYGPDDALDDAGGGAGSIVVRRELIGNTDEIIAAAFLPGSGDEDEEEEEEEADVGQDGDEKRRKRAAKTKKRPRALAVATNSALLRVFDPSTMACTAALPGHAGAILSLDASVGPNGECLVITGSRDHTVRLWDVTTAAAAVASGDATGHGAASTSGARCIAIGEGHVGAVAAVAFGHKNGTPIAMSGGADKVARVWDVRGALHSHRAAAAAAAGDDDDDDDLEESPLRPVPFLAKSAAIAHDKAVNCCAIAPNLTLGATCSGDRTARLWRLPDLIPCGVLRGHKRGVWAVAFSPADRVVATAGGDKTIKIWSCDPNTYKSGSGACLRTLEGHTAAALALKFVSGGTQIVSTGGDGLLLLWGVRTGAAIATLDAHEDKAWALAVDDDGDVLATGGADAKLTLWNDATAEAAAEEAAANASRAGATQELSNAAASGQHDKAARLALKLNHPHALLVAVKAMIANGAIGCAQLESLAATVKGVALLRFVCAIKAWNSNARFCDPAQRCLAALLRHRSLRELSGVKGVKDHVASLKAYTTRHFARAGRLVRGTYLLDVALAGMGVLLDDEEKSAPAPSAPPRRLLAEMARNWDSGRDDSVPMVGALGAPAKQAAALPALRTRGGDDEDDFDLGHFSEDDDDDGGGGGGGAVPDRFAAGGGDGDDDDDDDLSAEEDGDGDVESDSDDAPDEVATVKRGKGGAKEKPPPAKSADAAAALGLSAISPRKTRGQRRAESESDSEAAAAPEAAPAKPKKRAATKRKAALAPVEEEPATQPKRATRARSKK